MSVSKATWCFTASTGTYTHDGKAAAANWGYGAAATAPFHAALHKMPIFSTAQHVALAADKVHGPATNVLFM